MDGVAQNSAEFRADLFRETGSRIGLPAALVEKDFWVCWTLKQLFSILESVCEHSFRVGSRDQLAEQKRGKKPLTATRGRARVLVCRTCSDAMGWAYDVIVRVPARCSPRTPNGLPAWSPRGHSDGRTALEAWLTGCEKSWPHRDRPARFALSAGPR